MKKIKKSLPQVRDIIYTNRAMFTKGAVLTENEVLALFDREVPDFSTMLPGMVRETVQNLTFVKLGLQTKINKVLAYRGLYMKQRGTTYHILNREVVPRKVDQFDRAGTEKDRRAHVLNNGYTRHNCVLGNPVANRDLRNEPDSDWDN